MIQTITELQNREKQLHDKFHSNTPELKKRTLAEMNELTRLRVEMFNKLKSQYSRDIEISDEALEEQLSTLHIVESELQSTREQLKKINDEYVDKMRMVEISTYFAEKYNAYNGLFKLIFIWMIPIGLLLYLGIRNPVSEKYVSRDNSNTVFLVLILLTSFVALYQILNLAYDLKIRNNMNFNEYNFGGSFDYDKAVSKYSGEGTFGGSSDDGMGAVAYDEAQFDKLAAGFNLGCIDSSCCADGTMYDTVKKQCVSAAKVHGENTQNAALSKSSMGATNDRAENTSNNKQVEAFSSDNVPFSTV